MAKKALCVGINEYTVDKPLKGMVNDAQNWQALLSEMFRFDEVTLLTDQMATKANILDHLKQLITQAQPDDVLAFTFSGHGAKLSIATRFSDEVLIPFQEAGDGAVIQDDELRALFATLAPGVSLSVFLNSCYSGTGTRDTVRPPTYLRPLTLSLSDLAPFRLSSLDEPIPESAMNDVLLAASAQSEEAYEAEIDGRFTGVMPHFAHQIIRERGPELSYRTLHALLVERIDRHFKTIFEAILKDNADDNGPLDDKKRQMYRDMLEDGRYRLQTPQLEGREANKDRLIFS